MNENQVREYAEWVLSECNNPIDEIEWLVSNLPESMQDELEEHIESFGYDFYTEIKALNQNKDDDNT